MLYISTMLMVLLAFFFLIADRGGTESAKAASDILTIRVDAEKDLGQTPYLLRPGIGNIWGPDPSEAPSPRIQKKFIQEMKVGLVRISIERILGSSKNYDDFSKKLNLYDGLILDIVKKGGSPIILIAQMPRWLSSKGSQKRPSGFSWTISQTSPPKDYEMWAKVVSAIVGHYNKELGVDLRYEIWNEPDLTEFWTGTAEDYLKLYKYSVLGAKRADINARVGGGVAWWSAGMQAMGGVDEWKETDENYLKNSLLYRLIRYSNETGLPELGYKRLPIDFLVMHMYEADPVYIVRPLKQIRRWLKESGYGNDVKLIIDEWSTWSPVPYDPNLSWLDIRHDTEYGAAYAASFLYWADKGDLDLQSFFSLDSGTRGIVLKGNKEFIGGTGIFTPSEVIKPVYNTFRLFSMLQDRRINVEISADRHVNGIATGDNNRVSLLFTNFIYDPGSAFRKALIELSQAKGYSKEYYQSKGVTPEQLQGVLSGRISIEELPIPGEIKEVLRSAFNIYQERLRAQKTPKSVEISFDNLPFKSNFRYERYIIDSNHSNSYAVKERIEDIFNKLEREGIYWEKAFEKAEEINQWPEVRLQKVEEKIINDARDYRETLALNPYATGLILLTRIEDKK